MYRINDNPPQRFPEDRSLEADSGQWRVARLRSRSEKAFALECMEKGVGYYLPLYEKRTRRRDNGKLRKSILPLFPGYIALVWDDAQREFFARNKYLANVLKVANQRSFLRDLTQIQQILAHQIPFHRYRKYVPGHKVRIYNGPLYGMEGVIVRCDSDLRLVLAVDLFNQAISVNIGARDLTGM